MYGLIPFGMRRFASIAALFAVSALTGCHSHYIQTTITNNSGADVEVVQVDYPSASFGIQKLAAGGSFHYRYKLLGSGNIKIGFTDVHKGEHHIAGPWLNEGSQGTVDINIPAQDQAEFHVSVHP